MGRRGVWRDEHSSRLQKQSVASFGPAYHSYDKRVTGGETPESPLVYKWVPRRVPRAENTSRFKHANEVSRLMKSWDERCEKILVRIRAQMVVAVLVEDMRRKKAREDALRATEKAAKFKKARKGPWERRGSPSVDLGSVKLKLPIVMKSVPRKEPRSEDKSEGRPTSENAFPDGPSQGRATQEPPVLEVRKKEKKGKKGKERAVTSVEKKVVPPRGRLGGVGWPKLVRFLIPVAAEEKLMAGRWKRWRAAADEKDAEEMERTSASLEEAFTGKTYEGYMRFS